MEAKKLQLNGNKLRYHIGELRRWKNNEHFPPISFEFGPTTYCNHKCVHCYVQNDVKKFISMNPNMYLKFVENIADYGVKSMILGGCGEPMLHPKTPEAIELAVEHGMDVGMYSNGVPITEKKIPSLMDNLTFLRFSINGTSPESHYQIHRGKKGDFDTIKHNLEACLDYRDKNNSKCTLGIYTIVFKENIPKLGEWARYIRDIGVDYLLIKPPSPGMGAIEFVKQVELSKSQPLLEKITKLKTEKFNVTTRMDLLCDGYNRDYEKCLGLPFMFAADADGSIYTCNWFWGKEEFKYGNLYENSFKEIWEGERKKKIIEKIQSENFDMSRCTGSCKQNSINKYLWDFKNGGFKFETDFSNLPDHINFL